MTTDQAVVKLRDTIRLRHYSMATENCYVGWLERFCRFTKDHPSTEPAATKIEAFLTQLAQQQVSASTQNQAFNAVLFFYRAVLGIQVGNVDALRAKRPATIRTAPTVDEVRSLLFNIQDTGGYPTRLIVRMIYGMGLRVSEPLNLRVKDVMLGDSRLILRGAKGGKDRVVALPCSLASDLAAQLKLARGVWEVDQRNDVPVALPGLLAEKYPRWQFAWAWAFVFPSHAPCAHPRTGQIVRWRCHEVNVQRCVRQAAGPLGLAITPHHLRHAYATHLLNRGVPIKALSETMGHASIETTAGYCHATPCSVPSPLELCA